MIKIKTMLIGLVAMMGFSLLATSPHTHEAHADGVSLPLSVKNYVPDKYDFHDYWGGIGDIDPEFGDGITSFAHITGLVPLKGDAIKMRTSLLMLSANSLESGGDGVDGWITYSFSAQPGGAADNSYPYYGGQVSGYFLHITNFSSASVPNVVEMQLVQNISGVTTNLGSVFVDNIVTNSGLRANPEIVFDLELVKVGETYTLTLTNADTDVVLKTVENLPLDESLFINEKGQTFFSSALYEGAGCDGKHWEHRAIKVYNFDAYTYDASSAVITLDEDTFEYDGLAHRPNVTVTVNDVALVKDVDFYTEGSSVTEIGQGSVRVYFINEFAGNPMVEKTFEVVAIDASEAVVTLEEDEFIHTGSAIEPVVESVKLGDVTLVEDVDYTISFENNTAVGTGSVVVTFIGHYTGEVEVTFTITAQPTSEEPTSEAPTSQEPTTSTTPVTSTTPTSTPATSEAEEPSTGCFGSVTATLITAATLLGIGAVLGLKRKRLI